MKNLIDDFKSFIMKGDLVTIAVAFILAGAFKTVVDGFVAYIVTPIIAAIVGKPSFSDVVINIGDAKIGIGDFVNTVVSFLIIGAVLFLVVKAYEKAQALRGVVQAEDGPSEADLLAEIRDLLKAQRAG
ncbi:MAG: large conductance mechanosensitive channel protein MscL [Acidimicrobiia bacterium]